jgi:phosphatidylinositol alpha-1,6-mannosyltransferase
MRVLALVTDAFGGNGGIARYNQALVRALAHSTSVSEIVVLPRSGRAERGALPDKTVQLTPSKSRADYAVRAAWLAIKDKFDVLFCGHLNMCALAERLARFGGARLWLQIHGIDAWHCPGKLLRAATERADLVTAVSRFTRDRFLSWADVDPASVRVLPNTFEPKFSPGPKPLGLAQRLGLEGRKVMLTVSRLAASERYKGHDLVIRALPAILRHRQETSYVIVGSGDDLARLQALARSYGVAGAVHFVGAVPDDELLAYYRLADVFVMPSTGEGFGIVYLEAVASGVPVVAGNRDGSADALSDGSLGTLIDPDSPDQLVTAIISALDRPQANASAPSPDQFGFINFSRHVDGIVSGIIASRSKPLPVGR